MVYFDLLDEVKLSVNQIVEEMKKRGVLVDWAGPRRFRLVTHYWVDDAGVEKTLEAFAEVLDQLSSFTLQDVCSIRALSLFFMFVPE